MEDFIRQAAEKLNVSEDSTRSATGSLLDIIKDNSESKDFQELLGKVPGASNLVGQPAEQAAAGSSGGGLFGSISKAAGSLLGGKAGSAMDVITSLSNSGLNGEKGTGFITQFVGYLKEKAGGDLLNRVLGKIPQLKSLLG